MRIVAVLDVKGGIVVRGVGGRREEYRPIVSRLTPSTFPVTVAEAFREQLGLDEIYLADLDALDGAAPYLELYETLSQRGFRLWVDAGIRVAADAERLTRSGVRRIVAGLETLAGPNELARLCEQYTETLVFSLDLKGGKPLSASPDWPTDAWDIANRAIELGTRRLLLLDLARVGEGRGTGTEELCDRILQAHPDIEVSTGGGIRGPEDLQQLRQAGVSAVLVSSALHGGSLSRLEVNAEGERGASAP